MISPERVLIFLLGMLPFIGLAGAILYAGYVSYANARVRERRAREPRPVDPLVELSRLNVEIAEGLHRARLTLEATRETLQRGIRG